METKFQTSFIPKKPIVQEKKISSGISLFLLISLVVFFITSGLAGWVYFEKQRLIDKINEEKATITKNKNSLTKDSLSIENFVDLNTRIEISKELLSKHITVAPVFGFLQDRILKNVRFNSFVFSYSDKTDSTGKTNVKVDVSGKALNWRTMAAQVDELGKTQWKNIIKESRVSNLALSSDGSVSFLYSAYLSPDFIIYKTKK
jgi:hypothetical protein